MSIATTSRTPLSAGAPLPLIETDRSRLQTVIHSGHASGRPRTRAQVALKLGEGWGLAEVCRAFDVCRNSVLNVRARFAEGGVDAVLAPVPRRARPLDAADAGGQGGRAGLRRADLARDGQASAQKTS
jgi:hypothetical protein